MKTAARAPAEFNKTDVIWLVVISMAAAVTATVVSASAAQSVAGAQPIAVWATAGAHSVQRVAAETPAFSAQSAQPVNSNLTTVPPGQVQTSQLNAPTRDAKRFLLTGVVDLTLGQGQGQGVALISVDQQPAQPFHVGEQVAHGHSLQSVSAGQAVLTRNTGPTVKLGLSFPGASPSNQAVTVSAATPKSLSNNAEAPVSALSPESSLPAVASAEYTGPPGRADSRYRK